MRTSLTLVAALALALVRSAQTGEPGDLKWTFTTGARVSSCPAIGLDGTVYIASSKLYALDGATGAQLWTWTQGGCEGECYFSPVAGPDGTIYVGSGSDGKVFALDGATGAQKWSCAVSGSLCSFLALGTDGTVYAGSHEQKLHALDGATGTTKWAASIEVPDGQHGPALVAIGADGTVYAGPITAVDGRSGMPYSGTVFAFDGATGGKKWTARVGDFGSGSLAIGADGAVYAGGGAYMRAAWFLALDGATGAGRWVFETPGSILSSAVIGADGTVYVGSAESDWAATFYALDGTTGTQKWSADVGVGFGCSPALAADGTVYVGTKDGRLLALSATDGAPQWTYQTGGDILSLTIATDGTVLAGSSDGRVYAVQGSAGLADSAWPKFQSDAQNTGAMRRPGTDLPVIRTQSVAGRFVEGSTANLRVEATGRPPLLYQWFFQNAPIPRATNSLLRLARLQFNDTGDYYVEVSNPVGVATSSVATLTVGFGLTVTSLGVGTIEVSPALAAYDPGSSVELRAVPAGERQFVRWGGDASGTANPLVLTITGHVRVVAEFAAFPGDRLWTFATGGAVDACPAIGLDGTVYVLSDKLYALDGATGAGKWTFAADNRGSRLAPALAADGTVYLVCLTGDGGSVYALNGASGTPKWCFATDTWFRSSPALGADGTVYVGSDYELYSFDGATGAKQWAFTAGGYSSPALALDGTVYFGGGAGNVYALHGLSGARRWVFAAGNSILSSPAIGADGTVYVGSSDKKVYALNGATGVQRWAFLTGREVVSSPALGADGTVYIGSDDGMVYALDGLTGGQKWAFATGANVASSPAIATDGTVYVGSYDGKLYALDGATGAQKWVFIAAIGSSSPAIGTDGTVYIGSQDGKVHALKGSAGLAETPWPKFRGGARNTGQVAAFPGRAPEITEQPTGVRLPVGGEHLLSVSASGTQPLSFQWHHDGVGIPGAVKSFYQLAEAALSEGGDYQVIVANAVGSATSHVARVVVGYTLTLTTDGPGTVQAEPAFEVFEAEQTVVLTAIPGSFGAFVRWEGDASGTTNPLTLVMDGAKQVRAVFSTHAGELRWTFATGGTVNSSPALGAGGTLYVGSDDGRLYALDGATGAQKWAFLTGGPISFSPAVGTDGTVYFRSSDENFYALDGLSGARKWVFPTGFPGNATTSPALGADGTVFVGSESNFYALDGATGVQKWAQPWARSGLSPAVGADGTVYVSSDGKLHALNAATGATKWSSSLGLGGHSDSSPALGADGTVYLTAWYPPEDKIPFPGRRLYAVDETTGQQQWASHCEISLPSGGGPVVGADGTVYFGDCYSGVQGFDGATGTRNRSMPTGGCFLVLAADGTLYVGSRDARLYALNSTTGRTNWVYTAGGALTSSPALAEDGTVYFGAADARIYAVLGSAGLAKSSWPTFRGDAQNTGRVRPPAPLRLAISWHQDTVRIGWTTPGVLQTSEALEPAMWQDVIGATSPFEVEPANAQRFYRLRRPRRGRRARPGGESREREPPFRLQAQVAGCRWPERPSGRRPTSSS